MGEILVTKHDKTNTSIRGGESMRNQILAGTEEEYLIEIYRMTKKQADEIYEKLVELEIPADSFCIRKD